VLTPRRRPSCGRRRRGVAPLDEHDSALAAERLEPVHVRALRELHPQEVAALRRDEARLRQLPLECGAGSVPAFAQCHLHALDRVADRAGGAELGDDRLGDHARRDVGVGGERSDLDDQGRRPGEVADADARADRLRERRGVHDTVPAIQREHRGERLAREPQLDVGIVLEQEELVAVRELDEAPPLLERERASRGVVEVRDDVGELRSRARLERPGERLYVDPVRLQRDREDLGTERPQGEQRSIVGWGLHYDEVALSHRVLEQERVGLQRPVRGDHPIDFDTLPLRDPLAKRFVAGRGPVGVRALRVASECPVGRGTQRVDRDDVERGSAAGERDDGRGGHGQRDHNEPWRRRPRPEQAGPTCPRN
jgi:hypothetical protein